MQSEGGEQQNVEMHLILVLHPLIPLWKTRVQSERGAAELVEIDLFLLHM